MAKKTKTKAKQAAGAKLFPSQRRALAEIRSKRKLATLIVGLAQKYGTEKQKGYKRTGLERSTSDELRALAKELAVASHSGSKAHLSELDGWAVCWSEKRRASMKPAELLTAHLVVEEEVVTCSRCRKAAELPTPEESAAFARAELQEANKRSRPTRVGTRAKRRLQLKKELAVRLRVKDVEAKGVLKPDGTLKVKRTTYPSPHAAANALAGDKVSYRIDGFQAWRYLDQDGKWRMLRDYA